MDRHPQVDHDPMRTVVVVEGESDRVALETLAARRGHDLVAAGVAVVVLGGAGNFGRVLERLGPRGHDVRLVGLIDTDEQRVLHRGLARAGLGHGAAAGPGAQLTTAGAAALGFFTCDRDLEDELIRALGPAGVEDVIEREGDLASWRRFCQQPAQRDRPVVDRLRRFMGTKGGRKIQYAQALVVAIDLMHVPRPLDDVLERAVDGRGGHPSQAAAAAGRL